MDLRHYLFENRITLRNFAKEIGYCENHVRSIIYKKRKPSPRMLEAILKGTNGEVKKDEI